jgi:hypothetical protein
MDLRPKALESSREAVWLSRTIAQDNAGFRMILAESLLSQARVERESDLPAEVLESLGESARIYRDLAKESPDAFVPLLAQSLGAWGEELRRTGDARGAASKFAEALQAIKPLAIKLPESYAPLVEHLAEAAIDAFRAAGIEPDPTLIPDLTLH